VLNTAAHCTVFDSIWRDSSTANPDFLSGHLIQWPDLEVIGEGKNDPSHFEFCDDSSRSFPGTATEYGVTTPSSLQIGHLLEFC
jgi:hypothetical protein